MNASSEESGALNVYGVVVDASPLQEEGPRLQELGTVQEV